MSRAALLLAVCAGSASMAQEAQFAPQCTPFLTVQTINCEVDVYARCAADRDGTGAGTVRSRNYTADGLESVEETTADFSLLMTGHPSGRPGLVVVDGDTDLFSMTSLLADGRDTFRYPADFFLADGTRQRTVVTGQAQLAANSVTIDSHVLRPMTFVLRIPLEGGATIERSGNGLASAEFGVFMDGKSASTIGGRTRHSDATPVRFIEPGEPGFLKTTPQFNCNAVEVRLIPSHAKATQSLAMERTRP